MPKRIIIAALALIPLMAVSHAQTPSKEEKEKQKQCSSIQSGIKLQLSRLTNKNIIIDNNRLARANALLSLHQQLGCPADKLAKSITNTLKQ